MLGPLNRLQCKQQSEVFKVAVAAVLAPITWSIGKVKSYADLGHSAILASIQTPADLIA